MKTIKIKTIDIQAREWFDKTYGNSYFSMDITINYGLKNCVSYYVPMQYGYGDHYKDMAFKYLKSLGYFKNDTENWYHKTYENEKIIVRHNKLINCLKREL